MLLKFVDPPEPRVGKWSYDWTAVYRQLREHPGEWALLDHEKQPRVSVANALRDSKISQMRRDRGIQIRTANGKYDQSPKVCDIYLRYWPEADQSISEKERTALMKIIGEKGEG